MRTSLGICECDFGNTFGRGSLVDYLGVGEEVAAVPVRCVFAETDIGGDVQVGEERAEFFNGEDDGAGRIVCRCATVVLGACK